MGPYIDFTKDQPGEPQFIKSTDRINTNIIVLPKVATMGGTNVVTARYNSLLEIK